MNLYFSFNMKSITKRKRAHQAYEIMKAHAGVALPLNNWLTLINEGLTHKISLRSTKELAHMFRYIIYTMDVKMERAVVLKCMGGYKSSSTFYKLVEIKK